MAGLAFLVAAVWGGLLLAFRRTLAALWREPVFRYPVLILESDDWGAGPIGQAAALRQLAGLASGFRDVRGRRPVLSIAVVLAVARALRTGEPSGYRRHSLAEPEYAEILSILREGRQTGVFALQLHGMEHYWPPAVLRAAGREPAVAAWLADPVRAEDLPSHLQSRWTDAAELPSSPLSDGEIQDATMEEAALFKALFGADPEVAVPPTFVWDARVEAAWSAAGVRFVVTPGRRHQDRDASGRLAGTRGEIRNGMAGAGGVRYLVRDDYFEPAWGHRAADALRALGEKTRVGRPCLLEIHRFNFLEEDRLPEVLAEVGALYRAALAAFPDLRFISPRELGEAMLGGDPCLIQHRVPVRFSVWCRRALRLPRFGRLARMTGLALPMGLMAAIKPDDRV